MCVIVPNTVQCGSDTMHAVLYYFFGSGLVLSMCVCVCVCVCMYVCTYVLVCIPVFLYRCSQVTSLHTCVVHGPHVNDLMVSVTFDLFS